MGCSGQIMAGRGWSWVVVAKLWLVVGGDGKISTGQGWSWMVARFSNALPST